MCAAAEREGRQQQVESITLNFWKGFFMALKHNRMAPMTVTITIIITLMIWLLCIHNLLGRLESECEQFFHAENLWQWKFNTLSLTLWACIALSYIPININYISDYESIDIHAYLHKMRVLNTPRSCECIYTCGSCSIYSNVSIKNGIYDENCWWAID